MIFWRVSYCRYTYFRFRIIPMKHFHAHVYFEPSCLEEAQFWKANADLTGLFPFIKLHEKPVGPHPIGMIECHFIELKYAAVLAWITTFRGVFSVLIHQDTGDDLKDHTECVLWLGEKLKLNFDFFEKILKDPNLRIHPAKNIV